jgi:hypothetical protein
MIEVMCDAVVTSESAVDCRCLSLSLCSLRVQGDLKHIKDLKFWGPADVLMSKYAFEPEVARLIESFVLPCLDVNPSTTSQLHYAALLL